MIAEMAPESFNHCYSFINGVRYHFIDQGQGEPVLLLHGFPDCWYGWRYQIEHLSRNGYRVIVPDLLGFGESEYLEVKKECNLKRYTYQSVAGDMIALMVSLGITDSFYVVGHDLGAVLGWRMSQYYHLLVKSFFAIAVPFPKQHPEYLPLETLVKLLPNLRYQILFRDEPVEFFNRNTDRFLDTVYGQEIHQEYLSLFHAPMKTKKLDISFLKQVYKTTGFEGPLTWYKTREVNYQVDMAAKMGPVRVKCKTLICDRDVTLIPAMAKSLKRDVPQCEIVRCDATHWVMLEEPQLVNDLLMDWFSTRNKL